MKDVCLVTVKADTDCRISRVRTHDLDKLRYIAELGLVPGAEFRLLSSAPFRGPFRLRMTGEDHAVGYEVAGSLWVEV